MNRHTRWFIVPLIVAVLTVPLFLALRFFVMHYESFRAAGTIAAKEHELMLIATLLMLLVIVPVLALGFWFAWWYRAGNKKARYTPDWDHAKTDELIWWAIPFEIILVLSALTWTSTHELDPYKPLDSEVKPVVVEVVALDWKWLFIYPDLGIASVNELVIPANTPIDFKLTADAPMNSFWIPKLGSQIMVMTGMATEVHLIATEEGAFSGSSANFSGEGFSGMQFSVRSVSPGSFDTWIASVKSGAPTLDVASYNELAKPSKNELPTSYILASRNLFESIIAKFMGPMDMESEENDHGMEMHM